MVVTLDLFNLNEKMKQISNSSIEVDFFPFTTDRNTERITSLVISCSGIIFEPPVLYSIIWFERFGSDKKRTLLNMIFSMICWLFIAFFIFVQVPETFRYIYGPLPCFVCFLQLFIRYSLVCMVLLFVDAYIVERYLVSFLKLSCDSRFQRAFTACVFVFKVIILI